MNGAVSIIVLLYNDLPHAHRAIQSALQQTYKDLEIHILDNGSTDNTWEEIQQYKTDPRVRLVRNSKNQRSEFGARHALTLTTPYLSFLFADDIYELDRIEKGVALLAQAPDKAYVFFNIRYVDEHNIPLETIPRWLYSEDISKNNRYQHLEYMFYIGNSLHPCGMFVRTEAYKSIGGYNGHLHRIGDMVFHVNLLLHYDGIFSEQKKQRITIWSSGRNESNGNKVLSLPLLYERTQVLKQYRSPTALAILDKIFSATTLQAKIGFATETERLWFLAHKAIYQGASVDYLLFGFGILYKVIESRDTAFEEKIMRVTGWTMSEYMLQLQDWTSPKDALNQR